jgi:hypothetical protein
LSAAATDWQEIFQHQRDGVAVRPETFPRKQHFKIEGLAVVIVASQKRIRNAKSGS